MDAHGTPQPHRPSAAQTGLLIASALVSETFTPSLAPRSAVDQGIVTGFSVGSHYLLAVGAQDTLSSIARRLEASTFLRGSRWLAPEHRTRFLEIATDLAAVPVGCTVGLLLPQRPDEPGLRALARFAGFRTSLAGAAGASLTAGRATLTAFDDALGTRGVLARLPLSVPLGAAVAYGLERRRSHRRLPTPDLTDVSANSRLVSVAVAGGIIVSLSGFAAAEGAVTRRLGSLLHSALPGTPWFWQRCARLVSLAGLTGAIVVVWDGAMQRIEAATLTDEAVVFTHGNPNQLVGPTVSGSEDSLVPWATLGREGRRHVLSRVPTAPAHPGRPAGPRASDGTGARADVSATDVPALPPLPDLSIETVTGEPALAEPVQVYVGLDSAPTPRERVDLALAEMERLGAFDRSLLVLVSPTGTGYVNYVALAALQYLTRGDVATVTMQYSKRPSPLALGKVAGAREQNRLLWMTILTRLRALPPERRPRVVVFGESLGAHTSQDVFLNWGTLGPAALGIDRALWVGTPHTSGWMQEVTRSDRLDVDPGTVAVVNDYDELLALGTERRSTLRYVLVNHDNDGVTKMGLDIMLTRPGWLSREGRAPHPAPTTPDVPVSPRGTPPWMRWRPVTSFFQTLVDMKNAQQPGPYRAWAHDYRPDLLRFISEVYDLPCSPALLRRLDAVLREREELREALLEDAERRRQAQQAQH